MRIGTVVIGRNEGERLVRCLSSLDDTAGKVVYVDSGSTDGSASRAAKLGAEIVHLSPDRPFTAGRARNEGFALLRELEPNVQFVQFVDGDCELVATWIQKACEFLVENPNSAIVCGRRSERYPERSLYNYLCDLEWDTPTGSSAACGGDFLVRAAVFADSGGFNPSLIAGEEPELCHRLARMGHGIHRIDAPMTIHDAEMTRFRQWVQRSTRSGYAYAARAALHFRDGTRFCWRENLRVVFAAALLPITATTLTISLSGWWILLLTFYPVQCVRQWRRLRSAHPGRPVLAAAVLTVLGKWPEFVGQMKFLARELMKGEQRLIEYK